MTTPLVLRIVASSFSIANKSGEIIRNILKGGNLGIVDKATGLYSQKVSLHCMPNYYALFYTVFKAGFRLITS